jgi:hypothetical protein
MLGPWPRLPLIRPCRPGLFRVRDVTDIEDRPIKRIPQKRSESLRVSSFNVQQYAATRQAFSEIFLEVSQTLTKSYGYQTVGNLAALAGPEPQYVCV